MGEYSALLNIKDELSKVNKLLDQQLEAERKKKDQLDQIILLLQEQVKLREQLAKSAFKEVK